MSTTITQSISIVLLVDAMMLARKNVEFFTHSHNQSDDGTVVETAKFGKYKDMILTIVSGRPERPTSIECFTHIAGKADDAQEHCDCIDYSIRELERRKEYDASIDTSGIYQS